MGEFFNGWRRKTGVAALVMACVFAGGWMRSLDFIDHVGCGLFSVLSKNGRVSALRFDHRFFWETMQFSLDSDFLVEPSFGYETIVIPLALLSAYLRLSKPRPKNYPAKST